MFNEKMGKSFVFSLCRYFCGLVAVVFTAKVISPAREGPVHTVRPVLRCGRLVLILFCLRFSVKNEVSPVLTG